jgi:hypothetical protein
LPASTTAELAQGTTAYLLTLHQALLPALNADLAAKVAGAPTAPFVAVIGDTATAGVNKIGLTFSGDRPTRTASDEKAISLIFKVICLIPGAGNDSSANFEMARQVARDHLTTVYDDDALVLSPKINGGLLGTIQALGGERGPVVDLFPRKMADGVTTVRGFEMTYQVVFSLKVR